jgi:hydroxymethylpyrimidine/phosphomethylpyrimidine kinase
MMALSIAGFDPSGGAGILSDIKTFHALGVYGCAVITALTSQNVSRVANIEPVPLDFIENEIDLVMEGYPVRYAKTGMLYSSEVVELVARKVKKYKLELVVDPVLVAGSGDKLSQDDLANSIKEKLLPLARLTTPNINEAQILSGITIKTEEDALKAAEDIGKISPVVLTGGHLNGRDILYNRAPYIIEGNLIQSTNTHGSGCTYSAAITAFLARNFELADAVKESSAFVKKCIKQGRYGTLNQFCK